MKLFDKISYGFNLVSYGIMTVLFGVSFLLVTIVSIRDFNTDGVTLFSVLNSLLLILVISFVAVWAMAQMWVMYLQMRKED